MLYVPIDAALRHLAERVVSAEARIEALRAGLVEVEGLSRKWMTSDDVFDRVPAILAEDDAAAQKDPK